MSDKATFDALRAQVKSSLDALSTRVRAGHKTRVADGKEMMTLFRSAAFKRALEQTPDLRPLVDAATTAFKEDPANAKVAEDVLKAMQQSASRDLERLAKLLK